MKKEASNIFWMVAMCTPPVLIAICFSGHWLGLTQLLAPIHGFFTPCRSRTFGNGRRYHWVRQVMFGAVCAFVICMTFK
jgi:hypothetical protein